MTIYTDIYTGSDGTGKPDLEQAVQLPWMDHLKLRPARQGRTLATEGGSLVHQAGFPFGPSTVKPCRSNAGRAAGDRIKFRKVNASGLVDSFVKATG